MKGLFTAIKNRNSEAAIGVAAVTALIVLYFYFSQFGDELSTKQEVWGQFGDFVGGTLNPMLGFISVLVLVATLNLQRKELAEARKAALENNGILEEQLKLMHLQSLENTFFKMVDEFKKDTIVIASKKNNAQTGLLKAVFSVTNGSREYWKNQDNKAKNSHFRNLTGTINYAETKYVVLEKVANLVEIAQHLNNNQVHFGLLQTVIGPRILAAIIQLAYHDAPEIYSTLLRAKRLLKNINVALVFEEQVAKDFWEDNQYQRYLEQKESALAKFRREEDAQKAEDGR